MLHHGLFVFTEMAEVTGDRGFPFCSFCVSRHLYHELSFTCGCFIPSYCWMVDVCYPLLVKYAGCGLSGLSPFYMFLFLRYFVQDISGLPVVGDSMLRSTRFAFLPGIVYSFCTISQFSIFSYMFAGFFNRYHWITYENTC